jgi:predicted nucleotidyltransferase
MKAIYDQIVRILAPHAQFVIVYGSAATGRMTAHSDVDVAYMPRVDAHATKEPLAGFELQSRLTDKLGRCVDLIALSQYDPILHFQVVKNGVVIWERTHHDYAVFRMHVAGLREDCTLERASGEKRLSEWAMAAVT